MTQSLTRKAEKIRRLKKLLAQPVIRLQRASTYRRITRYFKPEVQILEASEWDRNDLQIFLNSGMFQFPSSKKADRRDFVAKCNNTIVGSIQLIHYKNLPSIPDGYWLVDLRVRLRYRRLGIGEALSLRVMQEAEKLGAEKLHLLVVEDNQPALQLYGKLGFRPTLIPSIEPMLADEEAKLGCRRVVLVKTLGKHNLQEGMLGLNHSK